jgi:hypothetical protein
LIKVLKRRRKKRKNKSLTEILIQYLIISLALGVILLAGCENGSRHSLELTEPTDHTKGDDGGEIKYKIIWGSTKHNDWKINDITSGNLIGVSRLVTF